MTYSTLMACLRLGGPNADLLSVAGELAERFGASVVGLAARQPMQYMFSGNPVPEALIEQERASFQDEAEALEAEFRDALVGRARDLEWRERMTLDPLSNTIANEARCADLVIVQMDAGGSAPRTATYVDIGELVTRAGRPVLVAPAGASHLHLDRVVVGWKETVESRRAIADALPLLKAAGTVILAPVAGNAQSAAERFSLNDVVAWLSRHGVAAEALPAEPLGDEAGTLTQVAADKGAGLIVAGAFGESRLREWVFGGATRDLLARSGRFALLSH